MRIKSLFLTTAAVAILSAGAAHAEGVVKIFNWSDYIDESILEEFTAETGIDVVYDVFDSNEILETRLLAGSTGYDIVVPTGTFMANQIQAGVFQPLNKDALSNLGNMDPAIAERLSLYDPGNEHAINYMWGTTGIGINVDMVKERLGEDADLNSWDLVFDPETAAKHGIEDDDWVWVISHHGRVKGQVWVMYGVNPETVWTWNAIGKRRGAWALDKDAPESNKGFLLNHIISELLPAREGGTRYSNSDPVTGQAAWYDLRVRLERCEPAQNGATEPFFDPGKTPPSARPKQPAVLRYGADLKGQGAPGADRQAPAQEWIGNRHEVARTVPGVADGRGNQKGRVVTLAEIPPKVEPPAEGGV